jgi:hypothetical protein
MRKLIVPKFATEREEAEWWDAHMQDVEENLFELIRSGEAKPLTRAALIERIRNTAIAPKKHPRRKAS